MSTSFTIVEDRSYPVRPQIGVLLMIAQQWVTTSLLRLMAERGHTELTAAQLMFLANLDCGDTYASEVARRMGVTRQAVHRSTRDLQKLKILRLESDKTRKTQKVIRMTKLGLQIVREARSCLADLEAKLGERIGVRDVEKLSSVLAKDWGLPLGCA